MLKNIASLTKLTMSLSVYSHMLCKSSTLRKSLVILVAISYPSVTSRYVQEFCKRTFPFKNHVTHAIIIMILFSAIHLTNFVFSTHRTFCNTEKQTTNSP